MEYQAWWVGVGGGGGWFQEGENKKIKGNEERLPFLPQLHLPFPKGRPHKLPTVAIVYFP